MSEDMFSALPIVLLTLLPPQPTHTNNSKKDKLSLLSKLVLTNEICNNEIRVIVFSIPNYLIVFGETDFQL